MFKKVIPFKHFQINNEKNMEKQYELERYFNHKISYQDEQQAQDILLDTLKKNIPEYQNSEIQQVIKNKMIEYKQFNTNKPRRISGRISYDVQAHQQKVQLQILNVVNQFDSVQLQALNMENYTINYQISKLVPNKNTLIHQHKYKIQSETLDNLDEIAQKASIKYTNRKIKHNIFNIVEKTSVKIINQENLQKRNNKIKSLIYSSIKMNGIKNTLGLQLVVNQENMSNSKFDIFYKFSGKITKHIYNKTMSIVNYFKVKFFNVRPKSWSYTNIIAINPFNLMGLLKPLQNYGFLIKLHQEQKFNSIDQKLSELYQSMFSNINLQVLYGIGNPNGIQLLYEPVRKKLILDFGEQ